MQSKKVNLLILLLSAFLNSFSQEVAEKIKLFEENVFHWDQSKKRKTSLQELMDFYGTNAVSIAVVKDFRLEWAKAYGYADASEKRFATINTLFQAASISKSINSLAILKLAEEGKINLSEDINQYLKSWQFSYDSLSKGKKINTGQLLSHTAGLSTHGFGGYAVNTPLPSVIQILNGETPANSTAVKSLYEPGLQYKYSGGGTTITQLMLEDITSRKYEDYMYEYILTPLDMTSSSYHQPPVKTAQNLLATGYYNQYEAVEGKYHIYPEKAAAGLWTHPTDLAKYIIETQLSLTGKSNKILSQEMSVKRLENELGVAVRNFDGVKYFLHNGKNEGFTCIYIGSFEGGNGLVIMTNNNDSRMLTDILYSIIGLNKWENFPLETTQKPISIAIKKEVLKHIDNGIKLYYKLKKGHPEEYNFGNESELNMLGYELMRKGNHQAALKIFDVNVREFPESPNVYDSRAEAYYNLKQYSVSKKDYLKSLELDPNNENAKEMLRKIEKP